MCQVYCVYDKVDYSIHVTLCDRKFYKKVIYRTYYYDQNLHGLQTKENLSLPDVGVQSRNNGV